jgi:hypothetical protein
MEPSITGDALWSVTDDGLARSGGVFLPVQARMRLPGKNAAPD